MVKADGDWVLLGRLGLRLGLRQRRDAGVAGKFLSLCWSLFTGLGCNVKSHQAVESASHGESHGGAVQQLVRDATL